MVHKKTTSYKYLSILILLSSCRCEFVIVAVPPPMHNRIVVHSPSQYLLLNAQTEYASDENVFFNMTYKTPPWGNSFSGDIMTTWDSSSNLNMAYNATHNDMGQFVLAGYLAEVNSTHTQEKGLFDTLNKCFETTEASNYLKYRERSHYSSNVKIDSSPMSVMKPTANINSINCIGVPTGRIFYASSEYAVNWPGTIDGAIEAGTVTAYSILTRIRPQALTSYELSRIATVPPRATRSDSFAYSYFIVSDTRNQLFRNVCLTNIIQSSCIAVLPITLIIRAFEDRRTDFHKLNEEFLVIE